MCIQSPSMTTLTEIEAAADALPSEQKQELVMSRPAKASPPIVRPLQARE